MIILERLFESKGVGGATWRRMLSRESDVILQRDATASNGAVLVSFWRLPGMPADSGTPTDWIAPLSNQLVNLHYICEPEIAAGRFVRRTRHQGHLDRKIAHAEALARLRELVRLGPIDVGRRVDVDTSREPELEAVVREVHSALSGPRG